MPESPRPVREFDIFPPSGRPVRVRHLTPAQRVRGALGLAVLLAISLGLWAIELSPLWRPIVALFR